MKTPVFTRALAARRRRVSWKLSSASMAIALSVLAHAAGLWLMPGWQRRESSTQAAVPEPLRLRMQVRETAVAEPPPAAKPERTVSARPAAKSHDTKPFPAQAQAEAQEERKPEILSVHRDMPPARPITPPGDGAPAAARVADHVHAVTPPGATAVDGGGIAGEKLAMATTRAEMNRHSDVAYLHNPKPAYPPMARKLGIEGTVTLRILVSADGATEQSRIITSSGTEALDAAAMEAVQRWRFVPARDGRVAIAHWVDVPISFKLGAR